MNREPLLAAGTILGIGMGGFVDGILFHQILQVHNMFSATVPNTSLVNVEVNMFWDGLFHAFTWLMTALGIFLFWKAGANRSARWSGKEFIGSLLTGWGIFNLVEGVLDHYVLGIHHVVERLGVSAYDGAFIGSGILFLLAGWTLMRTAVPVR